MSSSPCQRTKQLGGERRRRAWPPPACCRLPDVALETPRAPRPSQPLPVLLSLLWLSSRTHPRAIVAAARCCRGHGHCLASPMCSDAPPRPPLPLHRAAPRRKPCIAVPDIVFNLWPPANSSGIRELQSLPGLAVASTGFAVSPCLFPLSPCARPRLLATVSIGADCSSPPAMSPPRLRPCKHASELTTELTAPPRVQRA